MVFKQTIKHFGFTVLELLIGLAIVGLLSVIVFASWSGFHDRQTLANSTEMAIGVLSKARSQAASSLDLSDYGVRLENDKLILFEGDAFNQETAEDHDLPAGVLIEELELSDGGVDVIFQQLVGQASTSGSFLLTAGGQSVEIIIESSGAVYEQ